MNLHIEQPYVNAMLERFPDLAILRDQLRFGNCANIVFDQ